MALYTEEAVRASLRNRDGRRVFYLGPRDRLTDAARDFLKAQNIPVLPAAEAKPQAYRTLFGATLTEKPEHMTHLDAQTLVPKDHPRISFRGKIDSLEGVILLAQYQTAEAGFPRLVRELGEVLDYVRRIIRCDVLGEVLPPPELCGLTADELRAQSHNPQKYYNQPHFMPAYTDGQPLLSLNRVRTSLREAELACYRAFRDREGLPTRGDLVLGLNRLSSLLWILMIRVKAGYYERS